MLNYLFFLNWAIRPNPISFNEELIRLKDKQKKLFGMEK